MKEKQTKRAHLFVKGRVQGVFFRASTQQRAQELNLTGWVRNLSDGRVEIVAEGENEDLRTFLKWVREGPSAAQVDKIDMKWEEFSNKFNKFSIKY